MNEGFERETLGDKHAFRIQFTWREGISNWCQKAAGKQPGFKWATSFQRATSSLGEKDQQSSHFKNTKTTLLYSVPLH